MEKNYTEKEYSSVKKINTLKADLNIINFIKNYSSSLEVLKSKDYEYKFHKN